MSDSILDVFRDIHDNCSKQKITCGACGFYTDTLGCAFKHIPEEWRMKTIEDVVKKMRCENKNDK